MPLLAQCPIPRQEEEGQRSRTRCEAAVHTLILTTSRSSCNHVATGPPGGYTRPWYLQVTRPSPPPLPTFTHPRYFSRSRRSRGPGTAVLLPPPPFSIYLPGQPQETRAYARMRIGGRPCPWISQWIVPRVTIYSPSRSLRLRPYDVLCRR